MEDRLKSLEYRVNRLEERLGKEDPGVSGRARIVYDICCQYGLLIIFAVIIISLIFGALFPPEFLIVPFIVVICLVIFYIFRNDNN